MSDCFWAPESVVGLSKECAGAAPVESPWAYIMTPPEDWTPQPFGPGHAPGFPLVGKLVLVTTATLTGAKIARASLSPGDSGVLVSSTDDPASVDYTVVSVPAVLGEGDFEGWMLAESWLSPPLIGYGYAIIACRWDTNIGVVYTLSGRSGGV